MDFKKLAAGAVAGAALLAVVTPAFASRGYHHHPRQEDELEIVIDNTDVDASVMTVANTGFNYAGGNSGPRPHGHHGWGNRGDINTGNALAYSEVTQDVNYVSVAGCGCFDDVTVDIDNTDVDARVLTLANTGFNRTRGGDIDTGRAEAGSKVTQLVNTVVVGE